MQVYSFFFCAFGVTDSKNAKTFLLFEVRAKEKHIRSNRAIVENVRIYTYMDAKYVLHASGQDMLEQIFTLTATLLTPIIALGVFFFLQQLSEV